jgi:hypothetical protein
MVHLSFVLEERANDYLFLGLDRAEPLKGSLRKVRMVINRRANHAMHFRSKMTVKNLFSNTNLRIA